MILLTFLESSKVALINMVTILMSAKMTTPGLLKINVITSVHDITNKVLSCDSNYIADVVYVYCDQSLVTLAFMWEKLS